MLVASFVLLLIINGLQSWTDRRSAKGPDGGGGNSR